MAQLSQANIDIIKKAVSSGLISSGIAVSLYERSAENQTGLRDIQFILTLMKALVPPKKKAGRSK